MVLGSQHVVVCPGVGVVTLRNAPSMLRVDTMPIMRRSMKSTIRASLRKLWIQREGRRLKRGWMGVPVPGLAGRQADDLQAVSGRQAGQYPAHFGTFKDGEFTINHDFTLSDKSLFSLSRILDCVSDSQCLRG